MQWVKITGYVVCLGICFNGLVACSSEGPDVTYQGISAESAVSLLKLSPTPGAQQSILQRVEEDPQYGFKWDYFWTEIADTARDMSVETRNDLFSLGTRVCQKSSFNAFAKAIFHYPDNHALVLQDVSTCAEQFDDDNFKNYFSFYKTRSRTASPQDHVHFKNLLTARRPSNSDVVTEMMDSISSRQWTEMIRHMLLSEQPDVAIEVVKVYGDAYGPNGLVDVVFLPMTETPSGFDAFATSFGFSRTLDFLGQLPRGLFSSDLRSESLWLHMLKRLSENFVQQEYVPRTFATPEDQAFHDYEKINDLMSLLDTKVAMKDLLVQFDDLTRKMEEWVRKGEAAGAFLDKAAPSIYVSWLSHRLTGESSAASPLALTMEDHAPSSQSRLLKIHRQRLNIHIEQDPIQALKLMDEYCAELTSAGVPSRFVRADEFSWSQLEKPGCVVLTDVIPDQEKTWETEAVMRWSMSSLFRTGGVSLDIKAGQLDGSILDLSSSLTHENLPEQPTPDEDHAIVFPMVMGFQLLEPTAVLSPGIYYVASHFTYQLAQAGVPARLQPQSGYPGGDLRLRISEMESSILPKVISQGGAGQKAVPRTQGGKSSTSIIHWNLLQKNLLSSTKPSEDLSQDRRLLSRPDARMLRHIWEFAVKGDDGVNIKTFIDTDLWWRSLGAEDQKKVLFVCQAEAVTQDCAHGLAEKAAQQLASEISMITADANPNTILERLAILEFTEKAGALGPLNPQGEQGSPGRITIEGLE